MFDYRNNFPAENNAATSPGLGVFPGEMFLYEGRIFKELYPYYVTMFGRTFRHLSPHMGGTPAGNHALDPVVLSPGFDYQGATTAQRTRFDLIMRGAEDFAAAMGTILAHEIGHSVGLTANGPPSAGLHGDASLHNALSAVGDIMSAYVSWDSMVSIEHQFRDLNMSYLLHRCLLR
jgi:hypothetical protein